MHTHQLKILELAQRKNLKSLTLREIGEEIGDSHPQKIKHHYDQLLKKGLLKESRDGKKIIHTGKASHNNNFTTVPVYGSANCGQALSLASNDISGYLYLSQSILPHFNPKKSFALKTRGNSMNKANIHGETIEDGDYVIISKTTEGINYFNNKYVLSLIDGLANIKKLVADKINHRIVLQSESTQEYPPIVIAEEDMPKYLVIGTIEKVIKKPLTQ